LAPPFPPRDEPPKDKHLPPKRPSKPKQKGQSSPRPLPKLSLRKKLKDAFKFPKKRKSFLEKTDEDIKRELQKDQYRDLRFKKYKK